MQSTKPSEINIFKAVIEDYPINRIWIVFKNKERDVISSNIPLLYLISVIY